MFYRTLLNQASLLAFTHCFRVLALLCLFCAPLALFFKKTEHRGGAPSHLNHAVGSPLGTTTPRPS